MLTNQQRLKKTKNKKNMKLGRYRFILSFFFLLFYNLSSWAEDRVSTSPLINLNELKPSFEEVEDSSNDITSNEVIKDKKVLERMLLCEVQKQIYPRLEKALLNLIHDCGFADVKFAKKIDFEKLYKEKFN